MPTDPTAAKFGGSDAGPEEPSSIRQPDSPERSATTHTAPRRLVGWLNLLTGEYLGLPEGHQAPNYTVGTEWERVYEGDEVVGPWSVRRAS